MNDFQIITKLGEGAYSIVYKVKRLVDGNIYALKKVKLVKLSDKEKQNALNEVRILASVKSFFVISYKEAFFDESESCLCIIMEYADKGDLYQKICEFKKAGMLFEEVDIWRIFIQLTRGLKSLHDLKILHRDLKSANVFLLEDGSVKLGDLNVSKVARRGLGYTQTGTPYYASPEVWKDQPYDSKSDIWSLGCVLYEMITLRPPFRAENMEGLYNKVIKGQFSKLPERYSTDLAEIVKLLLQVNPDVRPNCDQILKHPIIQKRLEFFRVHGNPTEVEESILLQTIRIPKNLLFLTDRLPLPNYEKIGTVKNLSFPNNTIPEKKEKFKVKEKDIITKSDHKDSETPRINYNREERLDIETNSKKRNENKKPKESNISNIQTSNNNKSMINSPVKEIGSVRKENKNMLPNIQHDKKEKYTKKAPRNNEEILKLIPYLKNEHIANVYQIYSPYINNGNLIKKQKYLVKGYKNHNVDKYYEYNHYKPKRNVIDSHSIHHPYQNVKIIPNRKLSPIGNKMLRV